MQQGHNTCWKIISHAPCISRNARNSRDHRTNKQTNNQIYDSMKTYDISWKWIENENEIEIKCPLLDKIVNFCCLFSQRGGWICDPWATWFCLPYQEDWQTPGQDQVLAVLPISLVLVFSQPVLLILKTKLGFVSLIRRTGRLLARIRSPHP